eukprot:5640894-Lingulodinium_polyedra.AAC.1
MGLGPGRLQTGLGPGRLQAGLLPAAGDWLTGYTCNGQDKKTRDIHTYINFLRGCTLQKTLAGRK